MKIIFLDYLLLFFVAVVLTQVFIPFVLRLFGISIQNFWILPNKKSVEQKAEKAVNLKKQAETIKSEALEEINNQIKHNESIKQNLEKN